MDTVGRTTGMTVITPVPRWWQLWLRFNFWRLRVTAPFVGPTATTKNLLRLAFIGFAHWSLFERPPGRRYLLFQSNFNGAFHQYIEAFSYVVPGAMRGLWRGAGVPDPTPVTPFVRYIQQHKIPTTHYYSAYPQVSAKIATASLALRQELEGFRRDAARLDDDSFAAAYHELLCRVETLL